MKKEAGAIDVVTEPDTMQRDTDTSTTGGSVGDLWLATTSHGLDFIIRQPFGDMSWDETRDWFSSDHLTDGHVD